VSGCDANIIVASVYVHLGKQLFSFQLVDQIGNSGKWVGILDGPFINISIVLARAFIASFFLYKEEG